MLRLKLQVIALRSAMRSLIGVPVRRFDRKLRGSEIGTAAFSRGSTVTYQTLKLQSFGRALTM